MRLYFGDFGATGATGATQIVNITIASTIGSFTFGAKIKIFGSKTTLKCPDRLHIEQECTTGACYGLGASQDHPNSFTRPKYDFWLSK